jgi:hypothetical protein
MFVDEREDAGGVIAIEGDAPSVADVVSSTWTADG